MSADQTKMTRAEQLEQKLEERRVARAKAEETQYEADLEARLDLEDEHGTIAAVAVTRHVPGQPTRAYLRTPSSAEYKRYKDQIFRAANDRKGAAIATKNAQELLARACWVYPKTEEAQDAMLAAFPGLLTPLGMAAAALAEGKTEDAGKD